MTNKTKTCLASLAITFCVVGGCGTSKSVYESSSNLKQLSRALSKYQSENGAWPDTLEQIKPMIGKGSPLGLIGDGRTFEQLITNPLTGDKPGYEYVKPTANTEVVILYQLRGGKRDTSLAVAYSDGSVRQIDGLH